MLGSSSSSRGAAGAVHHPGCSSAGPRRKRLKTSHSLQRFANRFVDPWAFPSIQLDELTIEVVVETRSKASPECSSSSAASLETIRPFKNEAQRPKPASSVAKVLPVSPTKQRTACVPPTECIAPLESKNLCEIQPEEDFGRLETKNFYEAIAPTEEYFRKSSALHELSPACKRKRDQPDDESITQTTSEVAAPSTSTKPVFPLNADSQILIIDPNEINGHPLEVRGSSLPSISDVAGNMIPIVEGDVTRKTDEVNLPLTDVKIEAIESTAMKAAKYLNVPQTTRSLATGVTKSMAMVVPTTKALSQTVAAVRPQPANQLVIVQNEQASSVPQYQPLAQVTALPDGMVGAKSLVPTIVPAPPSYYVVDQSPPMQYYTPGPTMPQVLLETAPSGVPTEVLQIYNPMNSSGLPVLQATNCLPSLQPLTVLPASVAQQQTFNGVSQAVVPSGFRQAGPHNQLPRTSQSCSTHLSSSAPLGGPVSAPTPHSAACAGQLPQRMPDLPVETNFSDIRNGTSYCELNHHEEVSLSDAAQNTGDFLSVKKEMLESNAEKYFVDSTSSNNLNIVCYPDHSLALQSTSSPLKCIRASSINTSSSNLLCEDKCALFPASVMSQLSSNPLSENFSLATNESQFVSQRSDDLAGRDRHRVPSACNRNISLASSIQPVDANSSSEKYNRCAAQPEFLQLSARDLKYDQDVSRNGLNAPLSGLRSDCSLYELDGLVSQSSFSKLFLSKLKCTFTKTGILESLRNNSSETALHAILDDWFTHPCCSALAHLASMCRKISISKLFHWQVSRGFTYRLKVPRLLKASLLKKRNQSSLMALLCFRKVRNRVSHARDIVTEKNDRSSNSIFSSYRDTLTEKLIRKSGDSNVVVDPKQQKTEIPKAPNKVVSNGQDHESNIGDHRRDEGFCLSSFQRFQNESLGQLDSESEICKEALTAVVEISPPRFEKFSMQSNQYSDMTILTQLPSKSLCTFDAISLFSNSFDISFSSIARHFESEILEADNRILIDWGPSKKLSFDKTAVTSTIHNDIYFRQSSHCAKASNPVCRSDISTSAANCEPINSQSSHAGFDRRSSDLGYVKPISGEQSCLNEESGTYQRGKEPKCAGNLLGENEFAGAKGWASTLKNKFPGQAGCKEDLLKIELNDNDRGFDHKLHGDDFRNTTKDTQKLLPPSTKAENQMASFRHYNSNSGISLAGSQESTSSFGRSTFGQAPAVSSVKQKSLGIVDGSLFHQEGHRRLQSGERNRGQVDENFSHEIKKARTVPAGASPLRPDSDVSSPSDLSEDEVDDESSAHMELPNDDDAYEELLRSGYEVEKPSLKFPSETRLGLHGRVSYRIYGKVKPTRSKEKMEKYQKKKEPAEVKKKLKRRVKSHIARQTVDEIISTRQPMEMPSHIIVNVQGKLFMYGDEVS